MDRFLPDTQSRMECTTDTEANAAPVSFYSLGSGRQVLLASHPCKINQPKFEQYPRVIVPGVIFLIENEN